MTPGDIVAYAPDETENPHWTLEDAYGTHAHILGDEHEAEANAIAHAALPQCLAALLDTMAWFESSGLTEALPYKAARKALLDAGYTETKPL
jgi:hypothetical protein